MAISLQNAATETIETRKENKKLKMELEIIKKQILVSGEKVEAIDNSLESFGLEINDTELFEDYVGYNRNQMQGLVNTIPKPSSCKSVRMKNAKEDVVEE